MNSGIDLVAYGRVVKDRYIPRFTGVFATADMALKCQPGINGGDAYRQYRICTRHTFDRIHWREWPYYFSRNHYADQISAQRLDELFESVIFTASKNLAFSRAGEDHVWLASVFAQGIAHCLYVLSRSGSFSEVHEHLGQAQPPDATSDNKRSDS